MNIGIIGLGLIGGSFARAIKKNTSHAVFAYDTNEKTVSRAIAEGNADAKLSLDGNEPSRSLAACDIIIVALYPDAVINTVKSIAPKIPQTTVVFDCGGTKSKICSELFPVAEKYGFPFVGAHPMAGIEKSGYENSKADMFAGASFIAVPKSESDPALGVVSALAFEIGFGRIKITTPEEHDREIAYTSQLAHIVSSAYIRSEASKNHQGFSAGSFRDMTRVAYLNSEMWSQLFIENKDFLTDELDKYIARLNEYSEAIKKDDFKRLFALLEDGKKMKIESGTVGDKKP